MPELVVQGVLIAIIAASLAATGPTLAPRWRTWRWRVRAWRFVARRTLEERRARGRLARRRAAGLRALGGQHEQIGRGLDRSARGRGS